MTSPLVVFVVAGERFALPVDAVVEVAARPAGADASMAIRGETIRLVAAADRLRLAGGDRSQVVIVDAGAERVGVLVDAIVGIVDLPGERRSSAGAYAGAAVTAFAEDADGLIALLDARQLTGPDA